MGVLNCRGGKLLEVEEYAEEMIVILFSLKCVRVAWVLAVK